METIPQLTEQDIRARVGDQSFERGRPYVRDGAIFNTRRQGMTVKGHCIGSLPEPYRVQVTFDAHSIASADCSCPVGAGGHCKHVAALLLTWLEQPEMFVAVEEVETALERRDKGELIALIKQMLRQRPELELLLETPLPTDRKRQTPVTPEVYRRQAAAALRRGGHEWGASYGVASDLDAVIAIGDGFIARGEYASAATVFAAVSAEVLDHYEEFDDEGGELGGIVVACVEGLGTCLTETPDDTEARATIIEALFAVYQFDNSFGGVGISDAVPTILVEQTNAAERRAIAGWIRGALPAGDDWHSTYRRQAYGDFLLGLEADTLDDEAFLRICRETGRTLDLIERLLALGRVEEAAGDAARAGDYDLLRAADIFTRHGTEEVAARLILERSRTSQDSRILVWLKDYYQASGDDASALELAERLFRMRPGFEGYTEVRALATRLNRWEAIRPSLMHLITSSQSTDLLLKIYLDEGEIDRAVTLALDTLRGVRPRPGYGFPTYGYGTAMTLEVAKVVEKDRPLAARDIYQLHAERLIDQRGRDNYRTACTYLGKVRDLYDGLDQYEAWTAYLTGVREKHRALRALKEEMAAAGLLD